jgi:hypothetical protein
MSHVLELRRKTAQERLRSDHIDMIYQLENYSKENALLNDEIKRLELVISNFNINKSKPDSNNDIGEDIISKTFHEEEISKLHEVIRCQQNEIKTLQTSSLLAHKSNQSQIQVMFS